MCRDWINVLDTKAAAWGVPQARVTELNTVAAAAETAFTTAQNEATRTPVATAACRSTFEAMVSFMRDTKNRYFFTPPLVDPTDYISLSLKPKDATSTPSEPPTAQVAVETYLVGRHELGIKMVYLTGSPNDPASKGFRVWYSVIAQGETPPTNPEDLRKSFFSKRKKDLIEFDFGDSGKTAYFTVQIENHGKKGPWGPLVSAIIP